MISTYISAQDGEVAPSWSVNKWLEFFLMEVTFLKSQTPTLWLIKPIPRNVQNLPEMRVELAGQKIRETNGFHKPSS